MSLVIYQFKVGSEEESRQGLVRPLLKEDFLQIGMSVEMLMKTKFLSISKEKT